MQVRKIKFSGVHVACTDPSELLLEPGEVEIPHTLDVKLVTLVSETETTPRFPSFSSVFLQGAVASKGLDYQVLVISSDWLVWVSAAVNISSFREFSSPKVFRQSCHSLRGTASPSFSVGECCAATFHLFFYKVLSPHWEERPISVRMEACRRGSPSLLHVERACFYLPQKNKNGIVEGFLCV